MDSVVDEIKLMGFTELIILMAIVPMLHMAAHGLFGRLAKSLSEAWLRHIIWSSWSLVPSARRNSRADVLRARGDVHP